MGSYCASGDSFSLFCLDFLGDDVTDKFPYSALSLVQQWIQLLRGVGVAS